MHDATIIAVFGITWDTAADTSRSTPDTTEEEQARAPAQAASLSGRLASGASKAPGVRNAHGQLGVLRIAVHYSET